MRGLLLLLGGLLYLLAGVLETRLAALLRGRPRAAGWLRRGYVAWCWLVVLVALAAAILQTTWR